MLQRFGVGEFAPFVGGGEEGGGVGLGLGVAVRVRVVGEEEWE